MKTWSRLALPAGGAVVVALAALFADAPELPAASAATAATVATSPARIVAEGRLAAYPGAEVVLSTEVAGTLVALPIEETAPVARGALVAALRADDVEAELVEARARVVEAEAEIRLAQAEAERAEELYAREVDTAARVDRARRDLEVARARHATAVAATERIAAELAKRRIFAPIGGVLVARPVDVGETVEARAAIATIADLARVRVEAEVDEFDAARVRLGAPVIVGAEGRDGESWRGTVEEIPPAVTGRRLKPQDPGKPSDTRVLIVKIRLEEPTPLKLGQRVEVEIGR